MFTRATEQRKYSHRNETQEQAGTQLKVQTRKIFLSASEEGLCK
jgi:hypothetical protein